MNILRAQVGLSIVCTLLLTTCGGGSKGGGDPVALCKQGCTKYLALCLPDAGSDAGALAKSFCESNCSSSIPTGTTCSNASAIATAYNTCLEKTTCDDLTTCTTGIPACVGGGTGTGGSTGTGTGGSTGTGTGGSTGTGTGGSTGTGMACADLLACCNAATDATFKAQCTAQYPTVMAAGDAVCAQVLAAAKAMYCP